MNKKAQHILEQTIKLFLTSGIRKTNMDEIATNAHVAKMTLYKYFGDKEGLLKQVNNFIVDQHLVNLNNVINDSQPLKKRLYTFIDCMTKFVNSGRLALCLELTPLADGNKHYHQGYRQALLTLIDEGQKEGLIYAHLRSEHVFYYIDMSMSYYQHNLDYRAKMIYDPTFQNEYFRLLLSNLFVDEEALLARQDTIDYYCALAKQGTPESIGFLMNKINKNMTLAESKFLDFAIGHIVSEKGINVMRDYMFHGTPLQRNYCALFFNRMGDYQIVCDAFEKGLIDAIQAFSR